MKLPSINILNDDLRMFTTIISFIYLNISGDYCGMSAN